jgi:hypothetical protein
MGGWRHTSIILDLDTRWMWVASFMPLPLYPRRNRLRYPSDRRLGGPQRWSGRCGEEKNLALSGIEPGPSSLFPCHIAELHNCSNKCYFLSHLTYIHVCVSIACQSWLRPSCCRVKTDMDDEKAFLVTGAEEGSHCIVTLLLTGRATPYLHNGVVYVGDEDHYVSLWRRPDQNLSEPVAVCFILILSWSVYVCVLRFCIVKLI